MAHKVCIGGTLYEVDGGKAMVDGAVYEIDHGVANVDGTAYEVGFVEMVSVIITQPENATADASKAKVVIDGAVYDGAQDIEVQVPAGTIIEIYGGVNVYLNNTNIGSGSHNHIVDSATYISLDGYGSMVIAADDGNILFLVWVMSLVAVNGMTWADWVASGMNTSTPINVTNGFVYLNAGKTQQVYLNGTAVKSTDIILPVHQGKYTVA